MKRLGLLVVVAVVAVAPAVASAGAIPVCDGGSCSYRQMWINSNYVSTGNGGGSACYRRCTFDESRDQAHIVDALKQRDDFVAQLRSEAFVLPQLY